jgi:hypothetical protein
MASQASIDYAARALHLNRGDERAAVELLIQWCHSRTDVLLALVPDDEIEKLVKRVLRKVKHGHRPPHGRVSTSS